MSCQTQFPSGNKNLIPLYTIYDTFDGGNAVSISSRIAIFAQLTDDEKRLFCLFVLFREMKCEATALCLADYYALLSAASWEQ